jgi:rubrerythrin
MVYPETSSTPSGIFIQENIILKYLNELINDASECQHILVRNRYSETHVKLVELHRHEIQILEWNRDFLREKVKALKEASSKALKNEESEVPCEEHFDEDNINHLQREYLLMQMRLAEFQEMEIPDDEEKQIQFVIDREQIYNQVEDLEAKLIEARSELLARISLSRVLPQTIQSTKVDVPKNSSILSLIKEFTRCLEGSSASLDVQGYNLKSTKVLSSIELEHFWPWYEKFWTATRGADVRNKLICTLREFPDVFEARFSKEISAVITELEGDVGWKFPELNGASSMFQETILMISDLDSLHVDAASVKGDVESSTDKRVASCEARLSALGKWKVPWTLPLGLEYPTDRMRHQFRTLENALKSKLVESERHWENFFAEKIKSLIDMRNELEALVEMLDVEANAVELAAVEERRQKREIERQRKEADRLERERQRQLRERQAQEEKRRLQEEERLTNELFKNAAKNHSANYFGGSGDLRMCPQCQAGPVENRYCNDLSTHNRPETSWKGIPVEKHNRPNACPNCGYFSGNWHDWRYWDGIFGPH